MPPPKPRWAKISDPLAHARQYSGGNYAVLSQWDLWGKSAAWYTTNAHFGTVDGVRYYNNCGPTAVTNLICMYRQKVLRQPCGLEEARAIYSRVAGIGVRELYFINSPSPLIRGTSDLRAGAYIRRCFSKVQGISPRVRMAPLTRKNALRSLDQGALLFLMLLGHPEYGSHHLVGYGYTMLQDRETGEKKLYLKISDGHNPAPRYLDAEDFRRHPAAYYDVRFPEENEV